MSTLTGLTFGGTAWTPKFAQEIDKDKCIGCARCMKVCGHKFLGLIDILEAERLVSI
jgi:NAD-dependent dihydropyrimidine dehydrogenase PreA subunit